ncbi:MAG: M48 family peptidase, partial [Proteobacteria bacterium]
RRDLVKRIGGFKRPSEKLTISGRQIEVVRKPYKRSLGLTLKLNGEIRVSAPLSVTLARIEQFVLSQDAWIETHLAKYQVLREAHPQKKFLSGEEFPFMGKNLKLAFEPVGLNLQAKGKEKVRVDGDRLVCSVRTEDWSSFDLAQAHPEYRALISAFYQKNARTLLTERVGEYAARMNLHPKGLSFRAQKTRWGSCSSQGKISLNWKLVIAPLEVIDYVVIHELAHLQFYNHSKSFWNLVGTQSENYLAKREWLKTHQFDADFLASQSELYL